MPTETATQVALIQAVGRPDLSAKFHLLEIPFHVLLVVVLVGKMGIVGAALAWSIRAAVDAVLQFWAVARLTHLPKRFVLVDRIPQSVALLAGVTLVAWLLVGLVALEWLRLVLGGLLLVGVANVIWRYLLDERERMHLSSLLRPAVPAT